MVQVVLTPRQTLSSHPRQPKYLKLIIKASYTYKSLQSHLEDLSKVFPVQLDLNCDSKAQSVILNPRAKKKTTPLCNTPIVDLECLATLILNDPTTIRGFPEQTLCLVVA